MKINPEEKLLRMISTLKKGLVNENVKWINPGNIHITILFLGDTDEEKIDAITSVLKKSCEGSGEFELIIKGSGVFKNLNDPRVIWTGIEPSGELQHLNEVIVAGLKNIGAGLEDRLFRPHLTIGRIKNLKDKDLLISLLDEFQNSEIQKVPVGEVILYESILFHTGPVYKPLIICKL